MKRVLSAAILAGVGACAIAPSAMATEIRVTVTNTSGEGGLSLTPVYFGFHNGGVDLFDVGSAASPGIEEIAELGSFGTLRDERLAQQGNSAGAAALGVDGALAGPVEPGETATFTITLDSTDNRFLSFASMVVPSNDTFIGNDDPMQFALFDDEGDFLGPQTISVPPAFAYDAGTEVNNPAGGPAFVDGQNPPDGVAENGVISAATSLSDFVGLLLFGGLTLDASAIDFLNTPNFTFATIEISEVPVPPALAVMALGLAGFGGLSRLRRKAS